MYFAFTKDFESIKVLSNKNISEIKMNCKLHAKPVQAFCATEQQMLCIDCLILQQNQHKSHHIQSIEDASVSQQALMQSQLRKTEKIECELNHAILTMKTDLHSIEENA